MTKVVFLSDTHCLHDGIVVPECDILIHAGDISSTGKPKEVKAFLDWYSLQPAKHLVFIAGNHDITFESAPNFKQKMIDAYPSIHYLEDSDITLEGIKIYGSPFTPEFGCGWAFNLPRGKKLKEKWAKIPADTKILVTHGPPYGLLDTVSFDGEQVGCWDLLDRVVELKIPYHCYGHIHEQSTQVLVSGGTTFINAAICDDRYDPTRKPVVLDI